MVAADPKVIAQTPPAAEPPAREIPSFSKVAEESRDARTSELAELAGVKTGGKSPATPAVEEPQADAIDFDSEWSKLPEALRVGIVNRIGDGYNQHIGREYGEYFPLLSDAKNNPNSHAMLIAILNKPHLREMLEDPESLEQLLSLTKKDFRDFVFGDAKRTYDRYQTQELQNDVDPRDERLAKLESQFTEQRELADAESYILNRRKEMLALQDEFPELKESLPKMRHLLDDAESRFEIEALRAGIATKKKDGSDRLAWGAEAIRAGIRPPSYREVYEKYQQFLSRPTPPVAPATSPALMPAPAQAPRDAVEGNKRGVALLKNNGGLKGLQAAIRRK